MAPGCATACSDARVDRSVARRAPRRRRSRLDDPQQPRGPGEGDVELPQPLAPLAPQITTEMLDHVVVHVVERIQVGFSIDRLKDSITASIRDTVRSVVSETSERLVREEIERIKSRAQL